MSKIASVPSYSGSATLSNNKFRNPQLEAATKELEDDFNRILAQGLPERRNRADGDFHPVEGDDFYKLVGEFYSPDMKKHASPTKRLI